MLERRRGVSLLVLAITIIVMIILVGAMIFAVGDTNILEQATTVANASNLKQIQEIAEMSWKKAYIDKMNDRNVNLSKRVYDELKNKGVDVSKYSIFVTEKGVTVSQKTEDVGIMDKNYNLILDTGLAEGKYTLKYEDENGVLTDYADICQMEINNLGESAKYSDFIKQNIAPCGATKIGVYNDSGENVGYIDLIPGFVNENDIGEKLYSFGAIADIAVQQQGAEQKLSRALDYLKNEAAVDFVNIVGDLTDSGSAAELAEYKSFIEKYSQGLPVYAISGNTDAETYLTGLENEIQNYTNQPLYYSFTKGNDVYIMLGVDGAEKNTLFSYEALRWLYETLEANKDKRCFLFQHIRPNLGAGNANGIYTINNWGDIEQEIFEGLLNHYPNVVFFHAHSAAAFSLQRLSAMANYDNIRAGHSIHIPSLIALRDYDLDGTAKLKVGSEGYIVDVYENGIVLKGFDFEAQKYLPIAQYYIDTTLKSIAGGTYKDSTNVLSVVQRNEIHYAIDKDGSLYNGKGYLENNRLNSSGNVVENKNINVTGYIPVKKGSILRFENMDLVVGSSEYAVCYVWVYDSNFQKIKGAPMHKFNDAFDTYTLDENGNLSSLTIKFENAAYVRVSYAIRNTYGIITVN